MTLRIALNQPPLNYILLNLTLKLHNKIGFVTYLLWNIIFSMCFYLQPFVVVIYSIVSDFIQGVNVVLGKIVCISHYEVNEFVVLADVSLSTNPAVFLMLFVVVKTEFFLAVTTAYFSYFISRGKQVYNIGFLSCSFLFVLVASKGSFIS